MYGSVLCPDGQGIRNAACRVCMASGLREECRTVSIRPTNVSELGYSFGLSLDTYTRHCNRWVFGAEYLQKYHPYKAIRIPTSQFTAEGGYYYTFLSDANKVFLLSLGSSALAGYETNNWGTSCSMTVLPAKCDNFAMGVLYRWNWKVI